MSPNLPRKAPLVVTLWIILSALCSSAGWILSALGQLNSAGYAVVFVLALAAVAGLRKRLLPEGFPTRRLAKVRRRFGRAFPLAFLILSVLIIMGGALHAPTNYDALAYRLPRVLHWLDAGQWHWIHTDWQRINTRANGIEWLSAPLIALTRTDRLLFAINSVSFLLIPGLIYSLFCRVGVRARVAYYWMWTLPTGYCYVLQGGGLSNDMFSAVYALAAVDFALRARVSGRMSEACLSVLAAALMTNAKTSNLPLLLPWAAALLPTWRLWLARPFAGAGIVVPALLASFIPMAALNVVYTGDWTAQSVEPQGVGLGPAWVHLTANAISYTLSNLAPPVFPWAEAWNQFAPTLTPAPYAALLEKYMGSEIAHWRLIELQVEEYAGIGVGVTSLFGVSVLAMLLLRKGTRAVSGPACSRNVLWVLCITPWISLIFLMCKLNMADGVRYIASYYPLIAMGPLLGIAHSRLVRARWWRAWAFLAIALSAMIVVVTPARPLWPVNWFFHHFRPQLESHPSAARAELVYRVYRERSEALATMRDDLPPDVTLFGIVTADDPEETLWKPFGSRRILHVKAKDSREAIQERGIRYVLVNQELLGEPWSDWLNRVNARELKSWTLRYRAGRGPFVWRLAELN